MPVKSITCLCSGKENSRKYIICYTQINKLEPQMKNKTYLMPEIKILLASNLTVDCGDQLFY